MEIQERRLVLHQLASSEARMLELVEGLTPEQWGFRETPERWSIAEITEHVIAFENFVTRAIAETVEGPAEPDKKALAAAKDPGFMDWRIPEVPNSTPRICPPSGEMA